MALLLQWGVDQFNACGCFMRCSQYLVDHLLATAAVMCVFEKTLPIGFPDVIGPIDGRVQPAFERGAKTFEMLLDLPIAVPGVVGDCWVDASAGGPPNGGETKKLLTQPP